MPVQLLAGAAISAFCLWVAFRNVTPPELIGALQAANYWWLLGYPVIAVVLNLIRAEVWRILLKRKCGLAPAFWAYTVGFVFNNVLPFRIGEAARILVLARHERVPTAEVAASAALERILDLSVVLIVLACTLPAVGFGEGHAVRFGAAFALTAVAASVAGIYVLARWGTWFEKPIARIATLAGPAASAAVVQRWHQAVEGLSRLLQPSIGVPAFVGILIVWALTVLAQWCVLRAFQPEASILHAAFMVAFVSLAIAVPAAPGFVGVYQWAGQQALAGAFSGFYTPALALAIALVAHAVSYLFSTMLGVAGLWYFGASLKTLESQLRHKTVVEGSVG